MLMVYNQTLMTVESALQTFFARYPTRMYEKGEVLIRPEDKPAAYYITQGLVVQYDIAENGSKLILNTYKPGAFISLAYILNDIPSQFFFEASEHTSVHITPRRDVVAFLEENPAVMLDTLARISRGGDGMMLRLARAMEGSAEERILQELQIMKRRFFNDSDTVTVTETDLAIKTGLARETVSRALKKLGHKGVIRSQRGTITFLE